MKGVENALASIVGSQNVSTAEHIRDSYSVGYSLPSFEMFSQWPGVIVIPENTEQISEILKLANKEKIRVTVLGANTTNEAGGVADRSGIGIDLSFVDRILKIDEDNMYATVQGGCSVYKLMHALDKVVLRLPIFPGFHCAVPAAGYVSTDGMGFGSVKYGRIHNIVLGLEVVLPTGEIMRTGTSSHQNSSGPLEKTHMGPDLSSLFVGGSGAFGVITEVEFRIMRKGVYGHTNYVWPRDKGHDAERACFEVQQTGVWNVDFWNPYHAAIAGKFQEAIAEGAHFIIMMLEEAQNEEELELRLNMMRDICERHGGKEVPPEKVGPHFWELGGYIAQWPFMPGVISYVPSFYNPPLTYMEAYEMVQELAKKNGFSEEDLSWYVWGIRNNSHLPMGWIYSDRTDPEHIVRGKKLMRDIADAVVKKGWTPHCLGKIWPKESMSLMGTHYELIKNIKKLVDPNNIMNPDILYMSDEGD